MAKITTMDNTTNTTLLKADQNKSVVTSSQHAPEHGSAHIGPVLTIIIPHYKEPIGEIDKLFQSIDLQRQIDFSQLEIIVVNDCGTELTDSDISARYKNIRIGLARTDKNGGVGVARQRGIDLARGKFVMFIDCDDVLAGPHALFRILAAIYGKPETDLFHFDFLEEHIVEEQYGLYQHERNITFCHGKVYSAAFLKRKNIKCHPTLRYNEDSYFNALIYAEADKIEYISENVVVWCYNKNSTVRAGGLYAYKELPSYVLSISDLVEQLLLRKKPNAKTQFLYGLFYIYFQMQDPAWDSKRVRVFRDDLITAVRTFFKRYENIWDSVGNTELTNFYNECRKGFGTPIMEKQTFNAFLEEIKNGYTTK